MKKNTHEVCWRNAEGYWFSVRTNFITANELFESLKKITGVTVTVGAARNYGMRESIRRG